MPKFRLVWILLALAAIAFASLLIWLIDPGKSEDLRLEPRRETTAHPPPTSPDAHVEGALIEIGYWPTSIDPDRPRPHDFVDPDWSREEREQVSHHLEDGLPLPWDGGVVEWCAFCEAVLVVEELTDGTFVWPTHLVHYVSAHDVRLPSRFVLHVQRTRAPTASESEDEFVEVGPRDAGWWNALSGP